QENDRRRRRPHRRILKCCDCDPASSFRFVRILTPWPSRALPSLCAELRAAKINKAMRKIFWIVSLGVFAGIFGLSVFWPNALSLLLFAVPLFALGIVDMLQTRHSIRRNFPVIGHGRYLME